MMDRKVVLKEIIHRLHDGAEPDDMKKQFGEFLKKTTAAEISMAEEELIREGVPREQIQKLCDLHLAIFKESIEQKQLDVPAGHPIHALLEEHRILQSTAEELWGIVSSLSPGDQEGFRSKVPEIRRLVNLFRDSPNHYLREENVLFPLLERHGITQPPAIMWAEHDQIRETESSLYNLFGEYGDSIVEHLAEVKEKSSTLASLLTNHFYKEGNVLFQAALRLFSDEEWSEVTAGFADVGYCSFSPRIPEATPALVPDAGSSSLAEGLVDLGSGAVRADVLQAVLNTLPVDITFVDENDRVAYFSESPERLFVRSRAVIGRSVQLCHPQKSVHVVNKILDDFRSGTRDKAEFWINLGGQLVYIRYFAVRSEAGRYLGCLEVSQNLSEIKKIEGEKRLLDD
jgi:DUF438 domain-containing protein